LKIPLSLQNTAKPIQIITNDGLSRNAGSDISQLLNDVAGIDVVGSLSNPGLNKSVFLRGASGEYTLILLNGQPIIDPSGLGGVADLRSISTNDVQRIEILKGSQSAIYGSDAIAGVINIITDQNANQPITGHIRGAFGSFNSIDANAGVSASINDLSIRISGAREVSDGISEALELGDGDTFDKDGFSRTALSGNMTYDLSSKLKWDAFALYSDYEVDTDAGSFTDDMSTYETELLSLGTSLTYSSEKMNAALKYTNTSTDRNFESAFGAFPFFGRFNNWDAWVSLPINDDIKVIGGVNYQDHKMLDESTTIVDPNERIISPYLSLLGKLGQRTNFEAGLRYKIRSTGSDYWRFS